MGIMSSETNHSVFIREDEIFTGEEAVFTLKFPTKEKMQSYFPDSSMKEHEFFVTTDIKKPARTKIIVRIVHPETLRILVIYAKVTKPGNHPRKPEKTGLYYKIINLDDEQTHMIRDFVR